MAEDTQTTGQKPVGLYIRPEFFRLGLPSNTLLILAEIDQFCGGIDGFCWARNPHFQERFGLTDKTVTKALRTLEQSGLIHRKSKGRWAMGCGDIPTETGKIPQNTGEIPTGETPKNAGRTPAQDGLFPTETGEVPVRTKQESNTAQKKNQNKKASRSDLLPDADLPSWMPAESWSSWKRHLREIRKALTPSREDSHLRKLEEYMAEGHAPANVIEYSIFKGYQAPFPKPDYSRPVSRPNNWGSTEPPAAPAEAKDTTFEDMNRQRFQELLRAGGESDE